jgi:hypothetical protein
MAPSGDAPSPQRGFVGRFSHAGDLVSRGTGDGSSSRLGVGSIHRVLLPRTAGAVLRVQDGPDPSAPARNHPTTARSPS